MAYSFLDKACNLCSSRDVIFLGERIPRAFSLDRSLVTNIVKCRNCGLIYPNPMPIPDERQLQENYGNPDIYFPCAITEKRLKFYGSILKGINRYVKKGRLLDIGCGRGELLHVAKKQGWDVCGAEVSKGFADYAKNNFDVDVKVGELDNLKFADGEFDAVSLVAVLQHTHNPREILSEVNRILRDKGLLFMETMNNGSLLYQIGDLYYRLRGLRRTTHLSPTFPCYQLYGFSAESIHYVLRILGFRIVKIKIKGGISRTERVVVKDIKERIMRLLRIPCFVLANLLNKGQVLEVYAVKERKV